MPLTPGTRLGRYEITAQTDEGTWRRHDCDVADLVGQLPLLW